MREATAAVLAIFVYVLGGAVTAGYMHRKLGEDWYGGGGPEFLAPAYWPLFWLCWFAWHGFVKPVVPLVVGVYRISAGMTWSPPDEDAP